MNTRKLSLSALLAISAGALASVAVMPTPAVAADCTITVGRVVPKTGPLLDMGRETPWLDHNKVDPINKSGGLQVGDKKCKVAFKIYDSRGTMAGSGEAATRAILKDKVDVLFAQGTPDTTNAPSDLCERYKIPCITSNTPIEAWLFGPDGPRNVLGGDRKTELLALLAQLIREAATNRAAGEGGGHEQDHA